MVKETLNKSFDRLRTNGKLLIPFVVSKLFARGSKGGIEKQGFAGNVGVLRSDKDRLSTGAIVPVV